jgi:hypothetical protein
MSDNAFCPLVTKQLKCAHASGLIPESGLIYFLICICNGILTTFEPVCIYEVSSAAFFSFRMQTEAISLHCAPPSIGTANG